MLESGPSESSSIVNPLIKTDDGGDVVLPKVGEIGFRSVLSFFFIFGRMRSAESDKFVGDDPVEITILYSLQKKKMEINYLKFTQLKIYLPRSARTRPHQSHLCRKN